jgi:hypothetical protein
MNLRQSNQKPTFSAGFVSEEGYGKKAIEMASVYGYKQDPWQELILKQLFSYDVFQLGLAVPRQNGKNGIFEVYELYAAVVLGRRILHTAHESKTVNEHFLRLRQHFFENPRYPELMACAEVKLGRGSEEIFFDNGARLIFATRTATAGRGFSVDAIILDEAQEMNEMEWRALGPTLTASPDAKIFLMGTPPVSERTGQGTEFQKYRQKAYDSELEEGYVYAEWGITDLEKDDVTNEKVWRRVNPGWDYRINPQVIKANWIMLGREAFACEHLGYWYRTAKSTLYKATQWEEGVVIKRPAPEEVERFAVGIVYAQDGETWAASFGALLKDGRYYTELIDLASSKKGTAQILQIIAAFKQLPEFVGVLAHGRAGTLNLVGDAGMTKLIKPEIIEICRHPDKIASNALLDNLMSTGDLIHVDQEPLKASLLSLDKYMINSSGGGFSFISRTGQLISAEAAALALYWSKNRQPIKRRAKQTIL